MATTLHHRTNREDSTKNTYPDNYIESGEKEISRRGRPAHEDDEDDGYGIFGFACAASCCVLMWVLVFPTAGRAIGNFLRVEAPVLLPAERSPFVTVVLHSVLPGPKGRFDRLRAIGDTWGDEANAIFVVEENEDHLDEIVKLWPPIGVEGEDKGRKKLTGYPRILATPQGQDGVERLAFVLQEVYSKLFDSSASSPSSHIVGYVYMVNDHTFVLPSHLSAYLETVGASPVNPLYLGHPLINGDGLTFNTGAAGYVLSYATLRKVVIHFAQITSVYESCRPPNPNAPGAKFIAGNPGLLLAGCLKKLDASPMDTREGNGAHVFHAFGPARLFTGNVDQWYKNKHKQLTKGNLPSAVMGKQAPPNPEKLERGGQCCAANTVSFHYVEGAECRALWELRRRILEAAKKVPELQEIDRWVMELWPRGRAEMGGYAHAPPKTKDFGFKEGDLVVNAFFLTLLRDILGHS